MQKLLRRHFYQINVHSILTYLIYSYLRLISRLCNTTVCLFYVTSTYQMKTKTGKMKTKPKAILKKKKKKNLRLPKLKFVTPNINIFRL